MRLFETWNAIKKFAGPVGDKAHFQCMAACKNNEDLLWFDNGREKRCYFKGVYERGGGRYIMVEIPGSDRLGHTGFVSESEIIKLRKAVDSEREIATNQTGFSLSGFDSLVQFYDEKPHMILRLLSGGSSSYLVFGSKSTIEQEIKLANIFYEFNHSYEKISLQHIIRFHNLMSPLDSSRGRIVSSRESGEFFSCTTVPRIAIYDGSLAYLNHQGTLQSKMEIIFLDSTEPQFSCACGELMARYINREDEVTLFAGKPDAIEVMAFKE